MVCASEQEVLFDAPGKIMWELNESALSGKTVFCVYLGHGHLGEQPQVIEVTRDKQVIWEVADHTQFKTINQIMLLDVPRDVTKGEVWR
jgi:hypothetical protein